MSVPFGNTNTKGKKYPNRKSPPPFTEKHRNNISKGNKKVKHTKEWNEKVGKANKGKKRTKEMKERQREIILERYEKGEKFGFQKGHKSGMTGKRHTERAKEKIRKKSIGRFVSEETRRKLSETHKDKKFSEETIQKMKDNNWMKKHKGKDNPHWIDGKSFEPYSIDWTDDLKESIRKRDNYICLLCGIHQDELNYRLDIHHIDYGKKNTNFDNLVPLCRKCHIKTNYNRNWWIFYFANKVMKNA